MKCYAIVSMLSLSLLGSCSFLGFGSGGKDDPLSPDEQYLPMTGNSALNLGPDQANLFRDLEIERGKVRDLDDKIGRLTSENQQLQAQLKSANTDLSQVSESKTKSEHDASERALELRKLKTKVLMLQIENAQLEQAKILMRLAAVRSQQDAVNASKVQAMPMSGANR